MDFTKINKQFIALNKYEIVDIKEADFIPTLTNVLICFVVETEVIKDAFIKYKYDKCCKDYLDYIKQFDEYKDFNYEFMLLSKEEVREKYDGNYFYAMH